MPRFAPQPDEPAYDDETPEHVQRRMAELEKLARDLYDPLRRVAEESIAPAWEEWAVLSSRACALLDLDPPGFGPSTDGP